MKYPQGRLIMSQTNTIEAVIDRFFRLNLELETRKNDMTMRIRPVTHNHGDLLILTPCDHEEMDAARATGIMSLRQIS